LLDRSLVNEFKLNCEETLKIYGGYWSLEVFEELVATVEVVVAVVVVVDEMDEMATPCLSGVTLRWDGTNSSIIM